MRDTSRQILSLMCLPIPPYPRYLSMSLDRKKGKLCLFIKNEV